MVDAENPRLGPEPFREGRWPVDVGNPRDPPGLGIRIQTIHEPGLDSGAHIEEGERIHRRIQARRQASRVLVRLQLDAGEGVASWLGLKDPDGLSIHEEHVVCEPVPVRHLELADGDTLTGGEVQLGSILEDPAGCFQRLVDVLSGILLGSGGQSRSSVRGPGGCARRGRS